MSVLPHVYRTVGPLPLPVLANCLCDGQNVGLGECPMGGRAAVSTSAEAHELARIAEVRLALEILFFEPSWINQYFAWSWFAGKR